MSFFEVVTLGALALGAVVMFSIGALVAHLAYSISDGIKAVNARRRLGDQNDK